MYIYRYSTIQPMKCVKKTTMMRNENLKHCWTTQHCLNFCLSLSTFSFLFTLFFVYLLLHIELRHINMLVYKRNQKYKIELILQTMNVVENVYQSGFFLDHNYWRKMSKYFKFSTENESKSHEIGCLYYTIYTSKTYTIFLNRLGYYYVFCVQM